MVVRSRKFGFGVMLTTALSVSIWSTASQAYTPEQEQACSADAFRLCGAEIPDVERVTVCMARNKAQLSPACRAHFRAAPELAATPGPDARSSRKVRDGGAEEVGRGPAATEVICKGLRLNAKRTKLIVFEEVVDRRLVSQKASAQIHGEVE